MFFIINLLASTFIFIAVCSVTLKRDDELESKSLFAFDWVTVIVLIMLLVTSILFLERGIVTYASLFVYIVFTSYMAVISYIDLKYQSVYDFHVLSYSILLFCLKMYRDGMHVYNSFTGMLTGLAFYGLIYFLARVIYKKEAFGLGDVYLLVSFGILLGPLKTVIAGFMAFYLAVLVVIVLFVFRVKTFNYKQLPFGPYIVIAAYIVNYYWYYLTSVWTWLIG